MPPCAGVCGRFDVGCGRHCRRGCAMSCLRRFLTCCTDNSVSSSVDSKLEVCLTRIKRWCNGTIGFYWMMQTGKRHMGIREERRWADLTPLVLYASFATRVHVYTLMIRSDSNISNDANVSNVSNGDTANKQSLNSLNVCYFWEAVVAYSHKRSFLLWPASRSHVVLVAAWYEAYTPKGPSHTVPCTISVALQGKVSKSTITSYPVLGLTEQP